MSDVSTALAANRAAVDAFLTAADAAALHWTQPRAPGKWSPSQVVEHLARSYEESANLVAGQPSRFPTIPSFFRPMVRGLFFNRILKKGAFPRARTAPYFDPSSGPPSPAEGRTRLQDALSKFEQACQANGASGATLTSGVFGPVAVIDYVRFQELHALHHRKQLAPGA